jgi:hypothetical protein
MDPRDEEIEALREQIKEIRSHLAWLIPDPKAPRVQDWPVGNKTDADCLQSAYVATTLAEWVPPENRIASAKDRVMAIHDQTVALLKEWVEGPNAP